MNRCFNLRHAKLVGIASLVFVLSACDNAAQVEKTEPELRPVRTTQVEMAAFGPYQEFTAVVDASQKVDLAFKVAGSLVALPVKAGDEVKEGQLVAQLDDTDFKVRLNEAQSSFDKASSDFQRAKELIASNSISQADFDQLKAQYNSALAQLETAQNNLDYTKLHANFDGVIAQRYTENFQEINALTPVVALHDLKNINFKVDIPERIMINVKPNSTPPKVSAYFASIPDTTFDLAFKEISTQADEVTKTYQVVFTMPAPTTNTILPGMTARVRVMKPDDMNEINADFYLPPHAVLQDSTGNYVFTVNLVETGVGEIARTPITVGDITDFGIEVYSGVEAGQHVVTAGMSKVTEGMRVKFQQ